MSGNLYLVWYILSIQRVVRLMSEGLEVCVWNNVCMSLCICVCVGGCVCVYGCVCPCLLVCASSIERLQLAWTVPCSLICGLIHLCDQDLDQREHFDGWVKLRCWEDQNEKKKLGHSWPEQFHRLLCVIITSVYVHYRPIVQLKS